MQPNQPVPSDPFSQAPYNQPPKKSKLGLALGAVGVVILLVGVVGTITFMSGFLNSCTKILFDPTYDSPETKAFIDDAAVTARDLETFDALRGSFEAMQYNEGLGAGNEYANRRKLAKSQAATDEFRAQLEKGSWPSRSTAFSTGDSWTSPQLWVRIAELAQDYLEAETSEHWRVLNVSFPFKSSGPVPDFDTSHNENSSLGITFVCESGADKGLETVVSYYRWAKPAYFESHVEDARQQLAERKQIRAAIEASDVFEGRPFALTTGDTLYVWLRGAGDPLRAQDDLGPLLYDIAGAAGLNWLEVNLIESDAPLVVHETFHSKYGNTTEPELLDKTTAKDRLLTANRYDVHVASADLLRSQFLSIDESGDASEDYLSTQKGSLVPNEGGISHGWPNFSGESVFDDDLVAFVSQYLKQPEENLIALYRYDPHSNYSNILVSLVLSQGAFPTSYGKTEDAVLDLLQALWQYYYKDASESDEVNLFLDVYVVDGQNIQGPGGTVDFARLRQDAMLSPKNMNDYEVRLLLHADYTGLSVGTDEDAGSWRTDFGMDLYGEAPRSRTWFLASYGFGDE